MIESYYWKEDFLIMAKKLNPVKKPPRWSEKLQVNFEKEIIISFFMIRKLVESRKFSKAITELEVVVYRSPCVKSVNNMNFIFINELYDFEREEIVTKNINFICNQFIHGGAIFAYREKNRNWGGIYTCSDFERAKYIYRVSVEEIKTILEVAGNDYPTEYHYVYSEDKGDYVVETN